MVIVLKQCDETQSQAQESDRFDHRVPGDFYGVFYLR